MALMQINAKLQTYIQALKRFMRSSEENVLSDYTKEFTKLKTLEDKLRFAYKLLEKSNALVPKSGVKFIDDPSNPTLSEVFRLLGNKHYQEKDYATALEYYNQTLCYSEKGSKTMGLAYANRSAVYCTTGFYRLCLENIELALQNGYPEELKFKLLKRKNDCLYEMEQGRGKEPKQVIEPELSYPAHPTIPFIVEGIEMKVNKKYGRHLVAKQGFNPGDVLMIENQLAQVLYMEHVYKYCINCLRSNLMSLLPCNESLTAMFCSEKCYKESLEGFFKYERQIIDTFTTMHFHKKIIYRMVFETISIVKDFDGLKQFLDSVDENNKNPFEVDYRNASKIDHLRSFFTLESHENLRDAEYNLEMSIEAASMYHLIAKCTDLEKLIKTKEHEDTLMKFILRASMIFSVNGKRMEKIDPQNKEGTFVTGKAECGQLVVSLINHSCIANCSLVGDYKQVLVAIRPIKAGEQISLSYGEFYWCDSKQKRQSFLKSRHFFKCDCEACKKNYPVTERMIRLGLDNSAILQMVTNNSIEMSKANDPEMVMKVLNMANEFLRKNDRYTPCVENQIVELYQTTCSILRFCEEPFEVALALEKN